MFNIQSELMTRVQVLMKQKDDIEAEIKKSQDELQSTRTSIQILLTPAEGNCFKRYSWKSFLIVCVGGKQDIGTSDRLLDSNGFSRADFDLVVVTTARSNIGMNA
ncbi:hypothetical protein BGZ58_010855 [Dissophora ornata]|nr:hypothetical protein BGZ58_010855 [Dissophora ornata]